MSSRSRAAADLAYHLNTKVDAQLQVSWNNPTARPGHGAWRIEWTDGPTVATMRGHAEHLVRYCRPLNITMLRFSRTTTRQAWAAAMLALAHNNELPERPALAIAAAESTLDSADTAAWARLWTHAGQLVDETGGGLYDIVALIHATVTKPCDETRPRTPTGACQHCATPLAQARTGRPARYCGPPCRQAAHRARNTVTKLSNETNCTTCGRPFTPTGTGRPARHCSPACRTQAWRRTTARSH